MYFGMSISDAYLAATVNAAAVAKHHGVKAFINMSQMTVSQMSITETTASPQHKLHWLAEQALNWSGLPVVHVRPTVFLEGVFLILTPDSVGLSNQIRLPFGEGKTAPVAERCILRRSTEDPGRTSSTGATNTKVSTIPSSNRSDLRRVVQSQV